ncbi:MAG TPA: MMPL family transporter [Baekduia sp.]|uniref:MMPL family transporter n=1 Tax=Baekduia sp. TaxID=2600305 RepID=UPI002C13F3E1|nr:MMPL family transporter [Baekduia sp.]HMJ37004.1 MMPL family transporter [Baekduia sp.]
MRASSVVVAIDRWVGRHRAVVLVAWLALVAAAVPLALTQSDHLTGGGFQVPGSQSARADAAVQQTVPLIFRPNVMGAVLVADRGTPLADYRSALAAVSAAAHATPGVEMDDAARQVGVYLARTKPGRPVVVPLTLAVDTFHAPDTARELRRRLHLGDDGGGRYGAVQVHLVGQGALWAGMVDLTKDDLAHAERVGFPLVLLVLLGVFGSLAAAALPLAMGGVSVLLTAALIALLARHTLMSFYVPNMASMIGLGVAVDYSLFVVVRYREELRDGATPEQARATAMATSGTAVVFSGAAVVVALAGLLLVPTTAIRSMALGAIIVVLVSLLACVTLLPALLTVVGGRLGAPRGGGGFRRWAQRVTARPAAALVLSLLVLLALAAPVLGLKTGDGALRQFPEGNETRTGFEAAAKVRGRGDGSPLKVLVPTSTLDRSVALLRADDEIVRTGVRTRTTDKKYIFLVVTLRHDADSPQAKALVHRLRAQLPRGSLVGGDTAAEVDFNHAITGSLWKIVAWTLLATVVLLLVMLRSVPLALQAIAANVLSVAASFGVLTAVFVWSGPGYLDTVTIPVILAVVFGLSMDYEVFLLSRVRELHDAGHDARSAVLEGIAGSGRTITGAALVMVVVFACFAATGVPVIAEIGLGAAVAIALDATLVRLVVVPATLTLLGERAWWAPSTSRWRLGKRPAGSHAGRR